MMKDGYMTNRQFFKSNIDIRKNKRFFIISAILVVIICIMPLIMSVINTSRSPLNYRTFATMKELSHIDSYAVKELDCKNDRYLREKQYEEKYTKQILYNGNTFELYAYKFKDPIDAQRYCLDSNRINDIDKSYRFSYNEPCFRAFYHEYAYSVRGDNYNSFAEFYNFLVKDFTIDFSQATADSVHTDS